MLTYTEMFESEYRKELEKVYRELYSESPVKQKHALGRVSVWKTRAVHKLPVAVESTAALISAKLECRRITEEDVRVRNIYSFALMRFVNHITEKKQTTTYALPIHRLALEMGVPEWIVDLRHEATHGELPSLAILKAAADWCLQWLKKEFWEVQVAVGEKAATQEEEEEKGGQFVRDVLVAYQQHRYTTLNVKGKQKTEEAKNLDTDLETVFRDMGMTACKTLAEDGYLVFTRAQLDYMDISEEELIQNQLLSKKVLLFWKRILRSVMRHKLLPNLLTHLIAGVTEDPELRRNRLLVSWVYTIMWHNVRARAKKSDLFFVSASLPLKQLLDVCVQTVNPLAVPLIELLLEEVEDHLVSPERKQSIRELIRLYFNSPPAVETLTALGGQEEAQQTIHTTQDIVQAEQSTQDRWFRCTEAVDWSSCPIGVLPNQTLDYKSLELFTGEEEEEEEEEEEMDTMEIEDEDYCRITGRDTENPVLRAPSMTGPTPTTNWSQFTIKSLANLVQQGIADCNIVMVDKPTIPAAESMRIPSSNRPAVGRPRGRTVRAEVTSLTTGCVSLLG